MRHFILFFCNMRISSCAWWGSFHSKHHHHCCCHHDQLHIHWKILKSCFHSTVFHWKSHKYRNLITQIQLQAFANKYSWHLRRNLESKHSNQSIWNLKQECRSLTWRLTRYSWLCPSSPWWWCWGGVHILGKSRFFHNREILKERSKILKLVLQISTTIQVAYVHLGGRPDLPLDEDLVLSYSMQVIL